MAVAAYNFENNLSPVCMSDIYTLNSFPVGKTRRSVDGFGETIYVKEISRKSISCLGYKIWNGLDKKIKTSTSTNSFKYALKKQFHLFIYFIYIYIYIYIYIIYISTHSATT